jgi:hypothetical protein
MLFKTIDEIKEFWPVPVSDNIANVKPFIVQAERDYIIPAISQAQYTTLSNAYNVITPSLSPALTKLLEKVQAALALYAYYLWIPSGQLQISDSGIRIATNENLKTAFQWQIDDLQRSVIKQAGSAMEDLLAFMEQNKADYAGWSGSSAYTEFKDCFIPSAIVFTNCYSALGYSRLNFLAIRSHMKKVQETTIQAELSPEFYAVLKNQNTTNTLSDKNKLLIPYIQKAIANLTMANAFTTLAVTINENGILNFNNTGNREAINAKQPSAPSMISKLELQAQKDGETYIQILKDFLKANITDYPVYASSTAYNSETTDTYFKNDENQTGYVAML